VVQPLNEISSVEYECLLLCPRQTATDLCPESY
jgi:hypothetical protein